MPPKRDPRHRNVCLTLFSHTQFTDLPASTTYIVSGKEICPETKQEHLQIYAEGSEPVSRKNWQKNLDAPNAHLESRAGSAKSASDYCKKGAQSHAEWKLLGIKGPNYGKNADFIELGQMSHQGNSAEWLDLHQQIKNREITVDNIILNHPQAYHKFGRVLTETESVMNRDQYRNWPMQFVWISGPTETGKTRYVYDKWGYDNKIYPWNYGENCKQDNYHGQDVILLDEFHGQIKYNELLKLTDRYPYSISRRYKDWPLTSHYIYVCSSKTPEQVYKNVYEENGCKELLRRITLQLTTDPEELYYFFSDCDFLDSLEENFLQSSRPFEII